MVVYGQEARLEVKIERSQYPTKFQLFKNGHQLSLYSHWHLLVCAQISAVEALLKQPLSWLSGRGQILQKLISDIGSYPGHCPQWMQLSTAYLFSQQFHNSHHDSNMYGLTGRGVDDDNESLSSQPITIRPSEPSPAPSTATNGM